jgi:hypothetical protein
MTFSVGTVEPTWQLIVGQTVTQAANDKQQMVPLIETIQEQSGQKPKEVLADSGYYSEENLKYLVNRRMEGFIAEKVPRRSLGMTFCRFSLDATYAPTFYLGPHGSQVIASR